MLNKIPVCDNLITHIMKKRGREMLELYKNIKKRRQNLDMTQEELAKKLGYADRSMVAKIEQGKVDLPQSKIVEMANALHINPGDLMGWDTNTTTKAVSIPVYGTIPAGEPLEAIEDVLDNIEIPLSWTASGKEYFALKVRGDSMEPEYKESDIVIFEKTFSFDNGDDCAIYVNGYDATFKRLYKVEGGIMVQALNPNYPPYTRDDITVLGCAVEIRRKRK